MISLHKAPNMPLITFKSAGFKAIDPIQDDPVAISVEITNCTVQKTLWNTFKQLNILETKLLPHDDPLSDFARVRVGTRGCMWLYTNFVHEGLQHRDLKKSG